MGLSEAASALIVYATALSAKAALAQIRSSSYQYCYMHRLRHVKLRVRVLGVTLHTVPAFQPLADSAASRYILQFTHRGAIYFQIEDVFYVRVRRFLSALVLSTADEYPSVAKEKSIVQKLRDRMIANS